MIEQSGQDRPSRVISVAVALSAIAIAVLITRLAPTTPTATVPASTAPIDDASVEAKGIGTVAPLDFTLKDINGVDVKLASFKGKVILLNFWATWCPPCRAEIPSLVELQSQHGDDVVIIGMLTQDPLSKKTAPFVSAMKMNYPILNANDREDIESAFGGPFWGLPTSIIIDREGRIARKHSGLATKEQFEQDIRAAMAPNEHS